MSTPPAPLDSQLRFSRCHNVLVLRWPDQAGVGDVQRAQSELRAVGRAHRAVALLSMIAPGTRFSAVDEPTRREAQRMMALPDVPLVGSAVVFGGDGFGAAILRGVVSGISLVAGSEKPIRVFASASEAEPWLASILGAHAMHRAGELARVAAAL